MYSNSFTTAGVKNGATLSITSEESALIAINYSKEKKLQVSNNTDKTIKVTSIKLVSDPKHKIIDANVPFSLPSGHSREFAIANNKNGLSGKIIALKVQWNGGTAEIKSTIPELEEEEKIKEQTDQETDSEKKVPESIEEQTDPEIDAELEEDDEN